MLSWRTSLAQSRALMWCTCLWGKQDKWEHKVTPCGLAVPTQASKKSFQACLNAQTEWRGGRYNLSGGGDEGRGWTIKSLRWKGGCDYIDAFKPHLGIPLHFKESALWPLRIFWATRERMKFFPWFPFFLSHFLSFHFFPTLHCYCLVITFSPYFLSLIPSTLCGAGKGSSLPQAFPPYHIHWQSLEMSEGVRSGKKNFPKCCEWFLLSHISA